MATPSPGYSITVRVEAPTDPAATARLSSVVAEAGGAITALDVAESHPNMLVVGAKLVMPDLPSKAVTPNGASAGAVATTSQTPAPAGSKLFEVPDGGSLWKIAEKFAAEKKVGIHEMMKLIVAANPDKLKSESSILGKGWKLIIPE